MPKVPKSPPTHALPTHALPTFPHACSSYPCLFPPSCTMVQPLDCFSIALLVSLLSCLPIFTICTTSAPRSSNGSSSAPNLTTPNSLLSPSDLTGSSSLSNPLQRPVYVIFTIDRSKTVFDRITQARLPRITTSIKLGPGNQPLRFPPTTQIEIQQYSSVRENVKGKIR